MHYRKLVSNLDEMNNNDDITAKTNDVLESSVVLIVYPALKGCHRPSIKESKMAAGGRQSSKEVACQSCYVTILDSIKT